MFITTFAILMNLAYFSQCLSISIPLLRWCTSSKFSTEKRIQRFITDNTLYKINFYKNLFLYSKCIQKMILENQYLGLYYHSVFHFTLQITLCKKTLYNAL